MAARFKDFGSPVSTDEPVSFKLYGETYHCVTAIQGRFLIEIIKLSSGDGAASAQAVLDFFDRVLKPESLEKFNEMTQSVDTVVPMETLAEIMDYLVEAYAERPTEPSPPSSPGESTTGPASTDTPLPTEAPRYELSTQ